MPAWVWVLIAVVVVAVLAVVAWQAMRHFRALFEELVEPAADQPIGREQDEGDRSAAAETKARR